MNLNFFSGFGCEAAPRRPFIYVPVNGLKNACRQLMPPISSSLPRRWSSSESPILPFLAPRVFQPWPSNCAGIYQKTKESRDQVDDERLRSSEAARRVARYPKCLGRSSPSPLGELPLRYTRFRKQRITSTSFAHTNFPVGGYIRHFSSESGSEATLENNRRDDPATQEDSGASAQLESQAQMGTRTGTITSIRQGLGIRGSVDISSSLESRGDLSNTLPVKVPGARHVPLDTVSRARHLQAGCVPHFIRIHEQNDILSQEIKTGLQGDLISSSRHDLSMPGFQGSSSSSPSLTSRTESSENLKLPALSSSTGTSSQKYRNISDSSSQSTAVADRLQISQALHDICELWAKQQGLPELNTKYLKVDTKVKASFRNLMLWSSHFAIINQRHEDALKGYPGLEYNKVALSRFPMAAQLLFIKQSNVASLASMWRRVPAETRSHIWGELMLTSMDQHPASTIKLLLATYQGSPLPPQWAANDCLDFVVSHYFGSGDVKPTRKCFDADDLQHLLKSIRYLQHRGLRLSARSVYLLQLIMTEREFRMFYFTLSATRQHLTGKDLLRFAYRFARSKETDLAFRVLQHATQQGINLNLERWPQICHVLLARRYRDPYGQVTDTELFNFMLQYGLRPNIVTYNILIQNSLQAEDSVTAWHIYDMMIENGVTPDVYTYSIMVKDAKDRKDDAAIGTLVHRMTEDNVRNDYTATNILDAIFKLHRREYFKRSVSERTALPTSFSEVLPIYLKNFHIEPLAQLIPDFERNFLASRLEESNLDSASNTRPASDHLSHDQNRSDLSAIADSWNTLSNDKPDAERVLLKPNHVTLIIMLKSYITSVRNCKALLSFYDNFQSLISARSPIVAPLLQEAQIYNHLLVALGQLDAPMHDCLKIVADMQTPPSTQERSGPAEENHWSHHENNTAKMPSTLDDYSTRFESDDFSSNSNGVSFRPPLPSIHTWTTLLNIFMQRRQPRAAEKVLQIMIEKEGFEPNQATWNALTMGYMRLQDPLMAADAIIRTKRSGFIVDQIMSSRWWLRFQARARLGEALQAASDGEETTLEDVANASQYESEETDQVEEEFIDEEILDATLSKTGDIYRIIQHRLHAVNSPIWPNWIFDSMLRANEDDIIESAPKPITDDIAECELESVQSAGRQDGSTEAEVQTLGNAAESHQVSIQSPQEPNGATEAEPEQVSSSVNRDTAVPLQPNTPLEEDTDAESAEIEDDGKARLPANRLIIRKMNTNSGSLIRKRIWGFNIED